MFLTTLATGAAIRFDELQVVNDEQADIVAKFEPPSVGGDAEHVLRRGVVNKKFGLRKVVARRMQPPHFFSAKVALTEFVAVNACVATEQAFRQLNTRLFQADEKNRMALFQGDVPRDIQRECRFAHTRPGRDNDQFRVLQTRRFFVEIEEARGQAADGAAAETLMALINSAIGLSDALFESKGLACKAPFCDLQDFSFRFLQNIIRRSALFLGQRKDFIGSVDEVADNRFVPDNASVMLGVRCRGRSFP
ncbi:hypothetical protein HRbin36_02190 [bacterium HR36]|nr:hypothetical protein HRbin36_02190 [bacterium HR36]